MKAKEISSKAKELWIQNRLVLSFALSLALIVPALLWISGGQPPQKVPLVLIDDGLIAQGVSICTTDVSGLSADQTLQLLYEQQTAVECMETDVDTEETEQDEAQRQDSGTEGAEQEDGQNGDTEQGETGVAAAELVLMLPDRKIEVTIIELPVTPRFESAVNEAMLIGRGGSISQRMQAVEGARKNGVVVYIPYDYRPDELQEAILAISAKIPHESVRGSFIFDPSLEERFVIIKSVLGFTPDDRALMANVEAALISGQIHSVEVPGVVSGDPVDESATESVMENITLVGMFTTKVGGSSNRVHNIHTAADMINGKVVQPGEIFSTNETIGPRTKAAGIWRMAPAIVSGRLEDQLGGGVCQVSTTLFNAVARADLEILEWKHHSIPSSYVAIGCDATISTNGSDFKFKNNTEYPIYIVYHYEEGTRKLTCEVWGRPLPNGQHIEIIGKQTGTIPMPEARTTTDTEMVFEGRIGKYSRTYKVWYATDGKEISRELISKHTYPAKAPVVLVEATPDPSGGETPTPAAESTPAPSGT